MTFTDRLLAAARNGFEKSPGCQLPKCKDCDVKTCNFQELGRLIIEHDEEIARNA